MPGLVKNVIVVHVHLYCWVQAEPYRAALCDLVCNLSAVWGLGLQAVDPLATAVDVVLGQGGQHGVRVVCQLAGKGPAKNSAVHAEVKPFCAVIHCLCLIFSRWAQSLVHGHSQMSVSLSNLNYSQH